MALAKGERSNEENFNRQIATAPLTNQPRTCPQNGSLFLERRLSQKEDCGSTPDSPDALAGRPDGICEPRCCVRTVPKAWDAGRPDQNGLKLPNLPPLQKARSMRTFGAAGYLGCPSKCKDNPYPGFWTMWADPLAAPVSCSPDYGSSMQG